VKAISFYMVGVINAGDLDEASRIFDAARKRFEDDGRLLVFETATATHELTKGQASAQVYEHLVGAIDSASGDSARGWFARLLEEAKADGEKGDE